MKRLAVLALLGLLGCSSVTEPEPTPDQVAMAQADSVIAANQHDPMFMTAAGAGIGDGDPQCAGALRDYSFAVAAYAWALNTVRTAPSPLNIAWAGIMALGVLSAQANVRTHCSADPTRPA